MSDYRIRRFRGGFCLVWYTDGKRHRHALDSKDARGAAIEAPGVYAILTKPRGKDVGSIWRGYLADKSGRAVVGTMEYTWKALRDRFEFMPGDAISVADCRAHTEARRNSGISDGTIHTELGHLRMVLRWAEKNRLIDTAPHIERPSKPKPREKHITRLEARGLRDSASAPHVKLFIILAQTTGARSAALLDLTWDRCDFHRGLIDLRDPTLVRPHKGRAIVPMNRDARAALLAAKPGALTPYVIEYAGQKVASVRRGLRTAAKKAGLGNVSPHMLRRSAAIHMVEAGVPIEEVGQFLGHSNYRVTYSTYARFSEDYLRKAAEALEYDDLADAKRRKA